MSRLAVIIVMVSTTLFILALQCLLGDLWETWGYIQKGSTVITLLAAWEGLKFSRHVDDLIGYEPNHVDTEFAKTQIDRA